VDSEKSRQTTQLSDSYVEILRAGAETIEQGWFNVQTLLDRSALENPDVVISEFLNQVDDSHYSLTDWLKAILAFDGWLDDQKVEARPLASMIGYTHCCTMTSAETLSPPDLARLILENLNQWGFDTTLPVLGVDEEEQT